MSKMIYFFSACLALGLMGCSCEREGKDESVSEAKIEQRSANSKKRDKKRRHKAAERKRLEKIRNADVPGLIKAMKDRDETIRAAAVRNLGQKDVEKLRKQEVIDALIPRLADKNMTVRRLTIMALTTIGEPAIPAVVQTLRSDHPQAKVRFQRDARKLRIKDTAQLVLGNWGTKTIPALTEALSSDDTAQRILAANILGRMGKDAESAVPVMLENANDKEWTVRRAMVVQSAKIAPTDPKVKKAVIKAQKDENEKVQQAAATTLEKISSAS